MRKDFNEWFFRSDRDKKNFKLSVLLTPCFVREFGSGALHRGCLDIYEYQKIEVARNLLDQEVSFAKEFPYLGKLLAKDIEGEFELNDGRRDPGHCGVFHAGHLTVGPATIKLRNGRILMLPWDES